MQDQLNKAENGYIKNIKIFIYISMPSLAFLFMALGHAAPRWFLIAGLVGETVATLFWCNATRHVLKYIHTTKTEKSKNS